MRKFSSYAMITLKGIGMGAADVIPGVSGGTIAFLTGIYEELLGSIKSINTQAFCFSQAGSDSSGSTSTATS